MMGQLLLTKKQCTHFDKDYRITMNMDFVIKKFVEWCRQTFGCNGDYHFFHGEVVSKWFAICRTKFKGRIHYHLISSMVQPKVGLLGYMAIMNHTTSTCPCFVISLTSLMTLDPQTGHFLFGKCDQAKHDVLKNELSEAVFGRT